MDNLFICGVLAGLVLMRLSQIAISYVGGKVPPNIAGVLFGWAYVYMRLVPVRREHIMMVRRFVRHRYPALSCEVPKKPPALIGKHQVLTINKQVVSDILRKKLTEAQITYAQTRR